MKRSAILTVVLVLVLSIPVVARSQGPLKDSGSVEGIDIGSRRQTWFNTQQLIAENRSLAIVQPRPVKHPANPIMVSDKPWEGVVIQLYSPEVLYDPMTAQWQMWYEGHPTEVNLCTAFSKDGLQWTKPSLGLQEWKGSTDNNIVLQTGYLDAHCASIVRAPTEQDPKSGYKLYYWVGPKWFESQIRPMGLQPDEPAVVAARDKIKAYRSNGHYVAFSADGLHFAPQTEAPVLSTSDFNTTFFDEQTGRYRSYHKIEKKKPEWDRLRRCISMSESDDGIHFTPSVSVLEPTPEDDEWARSTGGLRTEFYGVHVWPQDGYYLGLLWIFRIDSLDPSRGIGWDDGVIAPYLIYSPDGIDWKRMPVREPFIPVGPAGTFDSGSIYTSGDHPAVVGDELRFYYLGVPYSHGNAEPVDSPQRRSVAGLATLRRDRFAGWQDKESAGLLVTKVLRFRGQKLHLNLDASRGELRVGLLDGEGHPLPRFSLEDCDTISVDSSDTIVTWHGIGDLSDLSGKDVRLQFSLQRSVVFTWQFQ